MRTIPRFISLPILACGSALLSGCSSSPPPPPTAAAAPPFTLATDMKQLMSWVIDPNADIVWASVGTIISQDGQEEIAPRTDEQWVAVRNSAAVIAESGNLLMMEGRARNQDDWMKKSQAMIDAATQAMRAAEAKDAESLFTAGSDVYLACSACHAQYIFAEAQPATGKPQAPAQAPASNGEER